MSDEKQLPSPEAALAGETSSPPSPPQALKRSPTMGSYSKLSHVMGKKLDLAIFRRFGNLNAQTLLSLQAEIRHLEATLKHLREQERPELEQILSKDEEEWSETEAKKIERQTSWGTLSEEEDDEQYELMQKIRDKLFQYNSFLVAYKEVCTLESPTKHDLKALRSWLRHRDCGSGFLSGPERHNYLVDKADGDEGDFTSDLVTVSREVGEKDFFTRWLSDELLEPFHNLIGYRWKRHFDEESGAIVEYRNEHVRAVSHLVGVILASIIPAASIFTLYFVSDMVDRLGILLAFSALFSICLALFTTARRIEIFAATAAFASVQVVFIGGIN